MKSLALLLLRVVSGGLLAGHGAQKLFGSFGGHGFQATSGFMESMGLKPGKQYAAMAGGSEFAGGALTALGLGGPIGPLTMLAPMVIATRKVHWGKPIWVTAGGAETPVLYMAAGGALALAGPGTLSLDSLLGVRVPSWMKLATVAGVVGGTAYTLTRPTSKPEAEETERAGGEMQGGEHAGEANPL